MVRTIVGAMIVLLSAAPSIAAEDCSKDEAARARPYYNDGAKAFRIGELQKAADRFKAAYEACPSPLFLYNLGQTYRQLKDSEKALYFYRQYLSTTSPTDERRTDVLKWIDQLQEQLESQRKSQPAPSPVPPSPAAGGVADRSRGASEAAQPLSDARTGHRLQIGGFAVGAVGTACLVVGAVFTGLAASTNEQIVDGASWSQTKEDRRNTYQTLDAVFFSVGGLAAATGLTLYLVGRHHSKRAEHTAVLLRAASTHGIGVALSGTF